MNDKKLSTWIKNAFEYIESDARNKKYDLAIKLVEEYKALEEARKLLEFEEAQP